MTLDDERNEGMALQTRLDGATLRRLASEAAAASCGFGFKRGVLFAGSVSLVHEATPGLTFQVRALDKTPLLRFLVLQEDAGDGWTRVEVTLRDHATVQSRGPMGIPTDRKRVAGIEIYRRFLNGFASRIRAADPSTTTM